MRAQHGGECGGNGSLAVRPADVNCGKAAVRIADAPEQALGALESPAYAAGQPRKELIDELLVRERAELRGVKRRSLRAA